MNQWSRIKLTSTNNIIQNTGVTISSVDIDGGKITIEDGGEIITNTEVVL